jgi:membrane fusion protein (multidrug efflux system)
MNKFAKGTLIVVIVLVVAFLMARPKIMEFIDGEISSKGSVESPANSQAQILNVEAVIARPRRVDNKISVTGSVLANESVEITSEISGKIIGIHFQEGQEVKKGELLVSLNDDELKAQLEKLQYTQKLYRDTEFRQRKLLEREAISQEEYEQAITVVKTNTADIKIIEAQLAKTKITAPFDGVIGLRMVSLGAYVTSSQIISSLYSINPAKVEFSIPSKYSSMVSGGMPISFTTDGSAEIFKGNVYALEPQIEVRTRTLKLKAISPNPQSHLLPGQFARIELILQTLENAIMLPTESVIPELDGHKVFLKKDGKVNPVSVEVGIRTDREIQILSGVKEADTVLTSGSLQVRPGQPITVTINNNIAWQD